jgi:alkyl hydroperoxide reductase subunit AhpC
MSMKLGDTFPALVAPSTMGELNLHEFWGEGWGILFSHPADFTPVCTTELGAVAHYLPEFTKRGVKLAAISCDPVESHNAWIADICHSQGCAELGYPILADPSREMVTQLGMIDPDEIGPDQLPMPARAVFVVKPNKKLALSILYPATTGRNFDEILRVVDSLQLTANYQVGPFPPLLSVHAVAGGAVRQCRATTRIF